MSDRDQGSFIGGLTIGMFAGALGYFLFATDKGKKLKKELAKEWDQARATLPDKGEGLTSYVSLKDLFSQIKQRIEESVEEAESKLASQPRKKAGPKKTTKFKGV